jgi:hypothetical protein
VGRWEKFPKQKINGWGVGVGFITYLLEFGRVLQNVEDKHYMYHFAIIS